MSFEDAITPIEPGKPLYERDFDIQTPEDIAAERARRVAEEARIDLKDDRVTLFGDQQEAVSDLHNNATSQAVPGYETRPHPEAAELPPFDTAHIQGAGKILVRNMRSRYTLAA